MTRAAGLGCARGGGRLVLAMGVLVAGVRMTSAGEPPRVVWVDGGRAYVAADSGVLVRGAVVRFHDRELERAVGEVTALLDARLASVRLSRGALDPRFAFDHWRVSLAAAARVPTLRVGLPSHGRGSLLAACVSPSLDPGALPVAYRTDTLARDEFRLVRRDTTGAPWPDTVLVRRYGVAADEEIALARGELDLAVFWPGEAAGRRTAGRDEHVLLGHRTRGVLAVRGDASVSARSPDLSALGEELFFNDLLAWPADSQGTAAAGDAARYAADASIPGGRAIALFLNRRVGAVPERRAGTARLILLDVAATADAQWPLAGARPLFALRCPVRVTPDRLADVQRLGPDAFANLAGCAAWAAP